MGYLLLHEFYLLLLTAGCLGSKWGRKTEPPKEIKIKMMEGKVLVFLLRNCPLPKERMINSSSGHKCQVLGRQTCLRRATVNLQIMVSAWRDDPGQHVHFLS